MRRGEVPIEREGQGGAAHDKEDEHGDEAVERQEQRGGADPGLPAVVLRRGVGHDEAGQEGGRVVQQQDLKGGKAAQSVHPGGAFGLLGRRCKGWAWRVEQGAGGQGAVR